MDADARATRRSPPAVVRRAVAAARPTKWADREVSLARGAECWPRYCSDCARLGGLTAADRPAIPVSRRPCDRRRLQRIAAAVAVCVGGNHIVESLILKGGTKYYTYIFIFTNPSAQIVQQLRIVDGIAFDLRLLGQNLPDLRVQAVGTVAVEPLNVYQSNVGGRQKKNPQKNIFAC